MAISLVYAAGRRQFLLIVAASIVTSLAIAGPAARSAAALLDLLADQDQVDAGDLAPYLAALGVPARWSSALSQAVANELRVPLGERVHRRAMDEILDVATEVELEAYEGSEFHDRLQRATARGRRAVDGRGFRPRHDRIDARGDRSAS